MLLLGPRTHFRTGVCAVAVAAVVVVVAGVGWIWYLPPALRIRTCGDGA